MFQPTLFLPGSTQLKIRGSARRTPGSVRCDLHWCCWCVGHTHRSPPQRLLLVGAWLVVCVSSTVCEKPTGSGIFLKFLAWIRSPYLSCSLSSAAPGIIPEVLFLSRASFQVFYHCPVVRLQAVKAVGKRSSLSLFSLNLCGDKMIPDYRTCFEGSRSAPDLKLCKWKLKFSIT